MAHVTIGGDEQPLEAYTSFKAFKAMELIKQVMVAYPNLLRDMQDYRRKYEAENAVTFSRAEAQFEFGAEALAHLSDEDWEKSENQITLPRSPRQDEVLMHVFPDAFSLAREHVLALCALALAGNRELQEADDQGDDHVTALLERRGKALLHETGPDELLELAVVASELAQEQIGDKLDAYKERLGNALRVFGFRMPGTKKETPAEPQPNTPSTDPLEEKAGSPIEPTSSKPSPEPTAGQSNGSSTEPAGSPPSSFEPVS